MPDTLFEWILCIILTPACICLAYYAGTIHLLDGWIHYIIEKMDEFADDMDY